jgi:ubiquinone/menaquinone biosynthesis C-methylase UbiE
MHTDEVKQLYKEWAAAYDDSAEKGLHYLVEKDIFVRAVNPKPDEFILDIGCGTGRYIRELLDKKARIIGFDISKEMLAVAKQKFPEIAFDAGNIEEGLPYPDEHFNTVICSLTFQFIQKLEYALQECRRVLKQDGNMFFTDFIADAPLDWKDVEYTAERNFKGSVSSVSVFRTMEEYKRIITQSGFQIVKVIPLIVTEQARNILTPESYEKVVGKWASVLFEVENTTL